jgi:hypothetical protein
MPAPIRGQLAREALAGAAVVWLALAWSPLSWVAAPGEAFPWALDGAKRIPAAEPPAFPAQPKPLTAMPARGQVDSVAPAGAATVLLTLFPATLPWVVELGPAAAPALLGATPAAVADPFCPQLYPLTLTSTSGQAAAPAVAGAAVVLERWFPRTVAWVLVLGLVVERAVEGARPAAVAEPLAPQAEPLRESPTTWQLAAVPSVGALVVFETPTLPALARVVTLGAAFGLPVVGAETATDPGTVPAAEAGCWTAAAAGAVPD